MDHGESAVTYEPLQMIDPPRTTKAASLAPCSFTLFYSPLRAESNLPDPQLQWTPKYYDEFRGDMATLQHEFGTLTQEFHAYKAKFQPQITQAWVPGSLYLTILTLN